MSSRRVFFVCLLLAGTIVASVASAQEPAGGHPVRFGLWVGRMDFSEELDFDGDQIFGVAAVAGFNDWVELSVALGQMTMRDQDRDVWSESVQFDMQWRFIPVRLRSSRLGVLLGVSFTGFEEDELSDAVAEGLDLGLGWNWGVNQRWKITGDLVWRMQSFNLVPRDVDGIVIGGRAETGYVWSRLLRLGVGYAF